MFGQYLFNTADIQKIFYNKCVVIIGDSGKVGVILLLKDCSKSKYLNPWGDVMRSIYKDLVLILQESRFLNPTELRRRGETSFMGDELIEGGEKGKMTNGKDYREVRQYAQPTHILRFYFITRIYNSLVETIIADLSKDPIPDVVIVNSCLWDITRYGPDSLRYYKENLQRFCFYLNRVLPGNTLIIWTTAMPVSNEIRGGFLLDHINFLSDILRLDQLMANFFASQVISDFKFDIVDLHYIFRERIHHRKDDGIHWDDVTHREITNILVTHICKAWNVDVPDRCRFDRGLRNSTRRLNSAVTESLERKLLSGQENRVVTATTNVNKPCSISAYSSRYKPY